MMLKTEDVSSKEAPWLVMGNLLILKPFMVGVSVSEIEFKWSPFWIQVHGLPVEKLTKANGEMIGKKIGRLIRVEAHCEELNWMSLSRYLEVSCLIDLVLLRRMSANHGSLLRSKNSRITALIVEGLAMIVQSVNSSQEKKGRVSGYGPELWTGVARNMGSPVEHYKKQVDSIEARIRTALNCLKD
ncbi:hypothetical protein ACSBR2_034615 [Camellia fascicularis]